MHLGTNLSARQVVRAVGVSGGLALAFFFAGVVMAAPQGGSGPTTPTTSCTSTTQQCSTSTSSNATTPKVTNSSTATSTGGASQTGSETASTGSSGAASNTGAGTCGCSNGNQTASDTNSATTTQLIVQVAPTTAVASATNYGHGSASATAVASPTQTATVSSDTRANDPAANNGNDHSSAQSTNSNTTTQTINQYAPTLAVADAENYGNGSATATAVAAPTQTASISNQSRATDHASNAGLYGNGQDATNTNSDSTTQVISQTAGTESASTTADASAINGDGCDCGSHGWNNGSGNATALAVAAPVQTASESSTSSVNGSASNVGYGDGYNEANNTSSNVTNQTIDQSAPTTAQATAINYGGHHSNQNASAVAEAQPTQVAIEASSAWVNGSANNISYGNGYGCNCTNSDPSATNYSSNVTNQNIDQSAPTSATATATNAGHSGSESATAVALANPSQKAGETSAVIVNGSATNYGLGRGDQIALNVSTNVTDQNIDQSAPTSATASAMNDGHHANQSASALATATPSQVAALASSAKVNGQAINTNVNTNHDDCGCGDYGYGHAHQIASNDSENVSDQTISQSAPTTASAEATNNGFSYCFGEGDCGENLWNLGYDYGCGCGQNGDHHGDHHGDHGYTNSQSATAIAAAAPVQEAAISANTLVNGEAINTNAGYGSVHQTASNESYNFPNTEGASQSINQDTGTAGTTATATAENLPAGFGYNQSAFATAAAAPAQAAAITNKTVVDGAALNTSDSSHYSNCECGEGYYGHAHQHATNTSENYVDQSISQSAPTTASASAINNQDFLNLGGAQVASAIAAATPQQGASLSDTDTVHGAAVNIGQGHGHQHATNTSENYVDQSVDQSAPTSSTATAENDAAFSIDGAQAASAVSAAAPSQSATITNTANIDGAAANAGLGGHFGHQTANNDSYNSAYQTTTQNAPTTAEANAENGLVFTAHSSQSISAVAAATPKQSATTTGYEGVKGSASNVAAGHAHQDAENTSANNLVQGIEQDATTTATANADDATGNDIAFSDHSNQSTTATAGAAPTQSASQNEADYVVGSASNAGVSQGHFGSQYAYNDSENNPQGQPSQAILQQAPTTADAEASNSILDSSDESLPVTAVAASAPSQTGSQVARNWAEGSAANTGLTAGCDCSFGNQTAHNTSDNLTQQGLQQTSENGAQATATGSAADATGDWQGTWGGFGCGCNGLYPFLGEANSTNSHATAGAHQSNSDTQTNVNNANLPTWNPLGSSDLSLSLPNMNISFTVGMSNGLVFGAPTMQQILSGSFVTPLLTGSTGLNMHLAVTTPWVQYAQAVANVTPFQVLFGYHA